ncbi:UNVERIFIED_CONTAM: hypothetical protein K2H54_007785 [Gekko kuhli]
MASRGRGGEKVEWTIAAGVVPQLLVIWGGVGTGFCFLVSWVWGQQLIPTRAVFYPLSCSSPCKKQAVGEAGSVCVGGAQERYSSNVDKGFCRGWKKDGYPLFLPQGAPMSSSDAALLNRCGLEGSPVGSMPVVQPLQVWESNQGNG